MSELNVGKLVVTEGIALPAVSTANRPSTPTTGSIIYNTSLQSWERWDGSTWSSVSTSALNATGGTIRYASGYKIHIFTGDNQFNVISGSGEVEYLIVAGGGGAGDTSAGGGGGGGLIYGTTTVTAQSYSITVGGGGLGSDAYSSGTSGQGGTQGQDSTAFGLTAIGGGGGASYRNPGTRINGGSSGGCRGDAQNRGYSQRPGLALQPTSASGGFGNQGPINPSLANGQPSTGGGGAGGPGKTCTTTKGGDGGIGMVFSISDKSVYYAGGGGGSGGYASQGGSWERNGKGGLGGGGNGGRVSKFDNDIYCTDGEPNSGGGGGGNGYDGGGHPAGTKGGAHGGSGIVIVRYKLY